MKNKPEPFNQNEFGQLTGMAEYGKFLTVIRPTHFGETFITGGWIVTICGGLAVGLLVAFLERISIQTSSISTVFGQLINCSIWVSLIDIESPLSYSIGGLLKLLLILAVLAVVAFQLSVQYLRSLSCNVTCLNQLMKTPSLQECV